MVHYTCILTLITQTLVNLKFLVAEIRLYAAVPNYQGNLFNMINWNPDPLNSCSLWHLDY